MFEKNWENVKDVKVILFLVILYICSDNINSVWGEQYVLHKQYPFTFDYIK